MFKRKEFKELVGFDHTWLMIFMIFLSAFLFPFIFLNARFDEFFVDFWLKFPYSVLFSGILVYGNLAIFYQFKTRVKGEDSRALMLQQWGYMYAFTIMVSLVLSLGLEYYILGEEDCEPYQSVFGACILSFAYIGFYETSYYLTALQRTVKMTEQLKRENVESQLEILKNQVKPHFLFNSLNTLVSLIPDEPDLAVEYVQKLSQVYRYILEIKDKKLIPLQEELDCIKAYLFMLKIRFGENLQTEIDETGLNFNHHIVPLSLQLLVENAVKHNIISNRKPLNIKIHKGKNGNLLVSNNLQRKTQQMPSTGTGLENIRSRYEIISDRKPEVIVTDKDFTVALPLVMVE